MFFCLEFLIFLSFTRCFANEIQWVMEHAHKQRKYRQHKYLPIIDASSHVASARPISTEFWWTYDVQEFNNSQSKYKLSMLSPWLSKQESWQPLKAEFPFPPEFALNTERRKCHSNTQKPPRNLFTSFFKLISNPCVSQPLMLKMMIEEKGKIHLILAKRLRNDGRGKTEGRATHSFFSSQSFLPHQ